MTNYTFEWWAMLEPMKYYDKDYNTLSDALKKKYDAMRYNEGNEYIASEKWDGEWAMFIKWNGQYLIRSRSISKVTGRYGDKTEHLPHLVEDMKNWPDRSVVLAEVCWGEYGTVSTDVGTILRCLPAKAIERQKEKKLIAKVFDILAWDDELFINKPYSERVNKLLITFETWRTEDLVNMVLQPHYNSLYFHPTTFCMPGTTPAEFADEIIAKGGEGCVIQRRDYIYEPGKRSAWKTLKLKQKMPEMELLVLDTIEANRDYAGKYPSDWPYWYIEASEDDEEDELINLNEISEAEVQSRHPEHSIWRPVTKPYYYGWQMGVRVDFNGTIVDVSSGLTDEDREWLSTNQAQELIANGQLYAVIKAMQVASLGALRHPVIKRLRIMDNSMLEKIEVE